MAAAQLVVPGLRQFAGTGFSAWAFRVKLLLEKEGVLDVLTKEPPNNDTKKEDEKKILEEFMKKDLTAREILVRWIDDKVLIPIIQKKTAKLMFKALEDTYVRRGLSAQVDLRQEINDLRYKFGSLREFLEENSSTRKLPISRQLVVRWRKKKLSSFKCICCVHAGIETIDRSYYEVKANLNGRLDCQKANIVHLENRVLSAKATYADALKNLETISNEIHKSRKGLNRSMAPRSGSPDGSSTTSSESTGSPDSYPNDEYLRLPDHKDISPMTPQNYQNNQQNINLQNGLLPGKESLLKGDYSKLVGSGEVSPIDPFRSQLSPQEASTTQSLDSPTFASSFLQNPDLLPKVPSSQAVVTDEEWSEIPLSVDSGAKPCEAAATANPESPAPSSLGQIGRRQSIDALLSGSTGKVKEIFSQGIMKLNIASISERRGSLESCRRKVSGVQRPSSRTSRYSTDSNEDPQSSDEMLSDAQIASLMLDEDLRSGNLLPSKSKCQTKT